MKRDDKEALKLQNEKGNFNSGNVTKQAHVKETVIYHHYNIITIIFI